MEENALESLLRNTTRIGAVNPAKLAGGGLGDAFQGYMSLVESLTGKPITLPNQQPAGNPFYTGSDIEERYLKPNLPQGYTQPQSKFESLADILLDPYAISKLGKAGGGIKALGKAVKSNLYGATAAKAAEGLGYGPVGQTVADIAASSFSRSGGLNKPKAIGEAIRPEVYEKAEKAAFGKPIPKIVSENLNNSIRKIEDNLEKGLHLKEKKDISKHLKDIMGSSQKSKPDIYDLVNKGQELNWLGYDSKKSEIERRIYRQASHKVSDAIKEYGKHIPSHGKFYEEAQNLTKLVKDNKEASELMKSVRASVGKKGISRIIPNIVLDSITEGKEAAKFLKSPSVRKAYWDLNINLLAHDKSAAIRAINRLDKALPKDKDLSNDDFLDLEDVEYLN